MVVIGVRPDAPVLHANPASEALRFIFVDEPRGAVRVTDGQDLPVPDHQWPCARASRGEAFSDLRLFFHLPNGKKCISAHAVPIAGDAFGGPAMAVTFEDVTAIVEQAHQLYEVTSGRDELMAVAAHELRSPLSTLQLILHRLALAMNKDGRLSPEELTRRVAVMRRQTERIHVLVQNLLDMNMRKAELATLDYERFDLCELVNDLVERWCDQANQAGCELRVSVCESTWGYWDRLRVEQVLTNLLANALKYGAGAPVEVSLHRRDAPGGSVARLVVADGGVGVPEEHREKIFERYHRAPTPGKVKGLGLGLYIVREIVRAHRGTIRHEPRPGGGSMFIVDLPVREREHESSKGAEEGGNG
ncbi:sensor histidine kinase [Polyangium aurulentum]|uniref:sensor histidine kinase n=1 Tax=Polyangium aurulentum TaxID=2567896 RepID=UPI0010AEE752|nr:HAMP domain-containing sensor histidine kinase [Polyangium aurulentum]UQA56333.1 HAMP domain-containing histidine kinase [Polyangium aurulentum]